MRFSRRTLILGSAAASQLRGRRGIGAPAEPAMPGRSFQGEALREIAFPLGGIGTGTVSLGGCGDLRDWEIFNRPNKGGVLPFTFAALRLAGGGMARPKVRVLERRPLAPFSGGSGLPRETGAGLPHLREAVFTGAYPFAAVRFEDSGLPAEITLDAFNPMVPLETDDSSLPVAILAYTVKSRATAPLDAALAFSVMNPVGYDGRARLTGRRNAFFGQNRNEYREAGGHRGLLLSSDKYPRDSSRYGSMALLTSEPEVSYRLAWDHGAWWDDFQKWWDEFQERGRFPGDAAPPSRDGETEFSTLASHFHLATGGSRTVTLVLAWHFPNTENYWSGAEQLRAAPLKNQYGTRWESAWQPAAHALANLASLRERSLAYRDTLWQSTLPADVLDAVSSQASILRTNTVMVMDQRRTLAFEGCNDHAGCCPMNCTHVYNYEQAMAHLYPDLERSMRETDFLVNMRPDGSMSFRTPVPLKAGGNDFRPAADGQMGCVMKVYREWRLGASDEWLRKLWPDVKRAVEYAWTQWDADRDGVMEGQQHNTYDIEFYGPNSMMGTLYLGALTAAARMAAHLGDNAAATEYRRLAEAGSARLDSALWNGEYYVQKVDESKQAAAKYQYGEGCLSDQLLGQWFAEVVDLGKLLPAEHIGKALDSIYRYNYRQSFEDFANAQRIYALEDEQGLLLCSWPRGKRPALPFVYSDEVWTGIEYQVAAHLIYEGRVKEGLSIVAATRNRYDGARRNPWNEVECGHHYARAMSSWSVLTALSGFAWSAPEHGLRFRPRVSAAAFRCLYSTGTAWGSYEQKRSQGGLDIRLRVNGGALELATLGLPYTGARPRVSGAVPATAEAANGVASIRFEHAVRLGRGEELSLRLA